MKVGDLVYYCDDLNDDTRPGLVLEIISWVDKGAPDRNFGLDIKVLWPDGSRMLCGEHELRTVDESR